MAYITDDQHEAPGLVQAYMTALLSLSPGAQVVVRGNEDNTAIAAVEWHQPAEAPFTESQIQAEIANVQQSWIDAEYRRQRRNAYPSYADQLDTIFHDGVDAWKAEIQAIKYQFPKP